jgi:hypothetical protein
LLVGGALLAIWVSFGSTRRSSVVSTWAGDVAAPAAAQQPAAEPLSALFEQQAAPPPAAGRTGLAADPHDPNMPWGIQPTAPPP